MQPDVPDVRAGREAEEAGEGDLRRRLVEAERRLAQTQAVAHIGSIDWDLESDRSVWSDELYRITGLSPGEFDGTTAALYAYVHPDDLEILRRSHALVTSRPGPVEYDYRFVRPDGAVRVLHVQMEMFEAEAGRGRHVVGVCQDVTEQRAGERTLKDTLSLLEATLESTADGLLVVDLAGHIVKYNARFVAIWHMPDEIIASCDDARALAFVLSETVDPAGFTAGIRALYADPERESYDEILLNDGRILERYSQAERIDGKPAGRVWSFRDVTARRRAEEARDRLLESERAARRAAQAAERRASLLSEASRILTSLDHESALASVADLLTQSFADCCTVDMIDRDGSVRRVAAAPEGGSCGAPAVRPPERGTTVEEDADRAVLGVPLAIKGRLVGAMRFTRGRPRGFGAADLALAEDVASRAALAIEIARLYRRTDEALRARDEFLSVASHELRTPLATLQATTEWLLAHAPGAPLPADSPLAPHLRSIGRQVRRLSRLVNGVLDAIAVTTTGIDLVLADEDLSAITAAVLERLRAEASRHTASVTLKTQGPVIGHWDGQRIEQVVSALLSNAIRYGAGKPITVTVERRGDLARLSVEDLGIGIAPERLPLLFDRFERAGARRDYGGLGLGLYVAHAIVARHAGSIHVESRPGEGSTFVLELPLRGPRVTP
jgi:PAS domain S-box-containing protein